MSAPDSQQSSAPPLSTRGPTAASNDRRAIAHQSPNLPARGGANSDQATSHSRPIIRTPDRSDSQRPSLDPASDDANPPKGFATAASDSGQQGQGGNETQTRTALLLWDPVLQTLAAGLDDVESTRIAQSNRYRVLTTTEADSDGETRGFGLAEDHPAVAALQAQLGTLEFLDKQMAKALAKQLRAHPLYPWVKAQKGLGDKTVARLLAAVRDPYWNDLHDRPRTVGELFAFCGVAGPGQRRVRGQRVSWSPDARKRLWIIATTIVKVGGPYRSVYDAGRAQYTNKTHSAPCPQCGKKGSPAEVGSDWRDGHKHAGAVRLVMREVLRDLWLEARAIYAAETDRRTA